MGRDFARSSELRSSVSRIALRRCLRCLQHAYDLDRPGAVRLDSGALQLNVNVLTITGAGDFPGIAPMICSLLSQVGVPRRVFVVDDGSLDISAKEFIRNLSDRVEFLEPKVDLSWSSAAELTAYASAEPMGKKLAALVELNLSTPIPLVYLDTDIWFTENGVHLIDLLEGPVERPRFMEDLSTDSLDSRALPDARPHVNSGFLILPPGLNWDSTLERLKPLLADPEWFTEQTVVHDVLHEHHGLPLPPDQYLLRWDDRRSWRDLALGDDVVARHYVTPVRHKYWIMVHGGLARTALALFASRRRSVRARSGVGKVLGV